MDDVLDYPTDTSYFNVEEPATQITERESQKARGQAARPLLTELIAYFEADIDRLQTVDSIPVDVRTNAEDFLKAWNIAQELKAYATEKKEYLESLFNSL